MQMKEWNIDSKASVLDIEFCIKWCKSWSRAFLHVLHNGTWLMTSFIYRWCGCLSGEFEHPTGQWCNNCKTCLRENVPATGSVQAQEIRGSCEKKDWWLVWGTWCAADDFSPDICTETQPSQDTNKGSHGGKCLYIFCTATAVNFVWK